MNSANILERNRPLRTQKQRLRASKFQHLVCSQTFLGHSRSHVIRRLFKNILILHIQKIGQSGNVCLTFPIFVISVTKVTQTGHFMMNEKQK